MHIKQEKKDIMATLTESDKVLSGSHDIIEVHLDSAQSPFVRVTSGATQENQQYHDNSNHYMPSDDVTEGVCEEDSEDRDQVNDISKGRFPQRIYQNESELIQLSDRQSTPEPE